MILLQQTLSLSPFLAGLAQLNLQAVRKQVWGLLQSNSNAIIFTGKLTQDPISSMRAGRKEEGEARGKLDNPQYSSFGMPALLFPES